MCELLGICADREIDIHLSFCEWVYHGDEQNPHGYGFAWWAKGELKIHKRPESLLGDQGRAAEVIKRAASPIFVAHLRRASRGKQNLENTHPFRAEFDGRDLVFAHNGTLRDHVRALPLKRRGPRGTTDSEHAFLWLLEQMEGTVAGEFPRRLKGCADEVERLGDFNFLLSDGERLWAYSSGRLHFLERRPPHGGHRVRLRAAGEEYDLAEIKLPGERAVLVATRPLTEGEPWQRLQPGELLVIRDGRVEERLT